MQPLPVDNVTAEWLAEYIWGEVYREIQARDAVQVAEMTMGVEEAPGQTAYYFSPIRWSSAP
jgi:hypothetical protein